MTRWFLVATLVLAATSAEARRPKKTAPTPEPAVVTPAPAAPTAAPAPQPLPSIAVLDLADRGVGPQVAQLVSETVLEEAHKLDGRRVIGSSEIRALLGLERQRQVLGCSDNSSCMSEIAGALGTDQVLNGSVGRVGDSWVITLQLIDSHRSQVIATDSERLVGASAEGFLDAIGPMFAKLFPDVPLRAGMTRGAAPSRLASASSMRVGTADRRFAFGTAGVAVALAAAGVVTGVMAKSAETKFNALTQQALTTPVSYAEVTSTQRSAKTLALATNVLYVAAGVGAVTSVVLFAFSGRNPEPAKAVNVSSAGWVPVAGGGALVLSGGFP